MDKLNLPKGVIPKAEKRTMTMDEYHAFVCANLKRIPKLREIAATRGSNINRTRFTLK